MSSRHFKEPVTFDDRKRLRESIKETELSASPKKGKHQDLTDAFSFPAFAAPLAEIAQQCCAKEFTLRAETSLLDEFEGGVQATPPVSKLWPGPGSAAQVQGTPEAQETLSFENQCHEDDQSITPAFVLAENAVTGPVQTLNARAVPLSPFEWGEIPDHQSVGETATTPASAVFRTCTEERNAASIYDSLSTPGAAWLEEAADEALTELNCAQEQEKQNAQGKDVSLHSQGASQSSSLADTKILRLSSRLLSKDASDTSHGCFEFSKAFTFYGVLGDTKTSTVYFAQGADGLFAIKEMKRPFSSKADRADMMRELRAVNSLPNHSNVVNYVRFWQEARKLHIQMELCHGGSLDTLLKRSEICQDEKLPEDLLWLILSDAAHGLRHIHAHGVLHMDIKPENMFLDASGVFKLGDFGIAINLASQSGWEEGDGRYVAPELLHRCRPTTGAADVYSLGATMLHCSIGTSLPLERTSQKVRRHLAGHGYTVEFQHIVASMLTEAPEDRPTAGMLSNVLQRKREKHAFEAIRQKLAQIAAAVHTQRVTNQRAMHCSPSFSLSQSIDNATPGSVGPSAPARPERVWSHQLSTKSRKDARLNTGAGPSPGSTALVDRASVPPAPPARMAVFADRGPAALVSRGSHPARVGTPPSVVPKLHQYHKRHHRSPSVGSFDRCGALSYSSNGQASGSLNLEMYPDFSVPAQGDSNAAVRSRTGMRTDGHAPQQHVWSMRRPALFHGQARAGKPDARRLQASSHLLKPPSLLVPDGRDTVQPSPRSDVLHRYFSSQAQHDDCGLKLQAPLPSVSTAALSQVEVTGPCEANTTCTTSAARKSRNRRPFTPRPPDLNDLKECLAPHRPAERHIAPLRPASKTKGRAMVWKGLQEVTSSSTLQGIVTVGRNLAGATDRSGPEPLKVGHGPPRRSRGAKIAGVASGNVTRDQENDGTAANFGPNHTRMSGPVRARDVLPSVSRPMQPHQSKLRVVKTLHMSRARENSTDVLASSRPELKQPLAVCHAQGLGA